jgi:predicted transcriptional regulator
MKPNLKDNIVEDITYKQVRDLFKKINFREFDMEDIFAYVFKDEINEDIKRINKIAELTGNHHLSRDEVNIRSLRMQIPWAKETPPAGIFSIIGIDKYNNKANELITKMKELGIIEQIENKENSYEITKYGHSFRMHKDLKRIPLKKAETLIEKIIKNIEEYNKDETADFYIDNLHLYGSVLDKKEDVGDIDLAFEYSSKLRSNETKRDWVDRIENTFDYDFFKAIKKALKPVNKAIIISPYISLMEKGYLDKMVQDGDAKSKEIYKFKQNEVKQTIKKIKKQKI